MDKHTALGGALVALLATQAPSAAAQEAYIAAGAGRSSWALDCGPRGCQRDTGAWRLAAGYSFNRVVALEAFYVDLGRARSSDFYLDGSLGATGAGVQALIGWQSEAFGVAGKIGLARMHNTFLASTGSSYSSITVRRNELIGALTASYRVTPSVALRMDLDIVTVALDGDFIRYVRGSDVRTLLLGVRLAF